MLFNSYIFILAFLPVTLTGYFLLNRYGKTSASKLWLCGMSLVFYGYFNIKYLPVIIFSILLNFFFSRFLISSEKENLRKAVLCFSVFLNVGVLFFFKYLDFFIENVNAVFKAELPLLKIALPLGISFFTFQQLSFIIDSYKRKVPRYAFLDYALFVSFFPQLIAGPIVLHSEMLPQFADKNNKRLNAENFSKGLFAFSLGLAKKVLIADALSGAVDAGYIETDFFLNTTNGLIIMLAYTLQIYFDFSGYCDMSIGLGYMFNIKLPINFNSPYRALDMSDFWRRWHITLTRFFTEYLYIPLGGNRKGKKRTYLNIFIVMLVSGIWHGANHTFFLWGALHGLSLVITRMLKEKLRKIPKAVTWLFTFSFVNVTWIIFRSSSVREALFIIHRLVMMKFSAPDIKLAEKIIGSDLTFVFGGLPAVEYVAAFSLIAFALFASVKMKNTSERLETFKPSKMNAAATVILLTLSIISLSGVSAFLYFDF
ncbi:MAG: MBOAT family protein [Clostridiales bacterium]|nr:MBOAT family protein [Clostridiales bacterium]